MTRISSAAGGLKNRQELEMISAKSGYGQVKRTLYFIYLERIIKAGFVFQHFGQIIQLFWSSFLFAYSDLLLIARLECVKTGAAKNQWVLMQMNSI